MLFLFLFEEDAGDTGDEPVAVSVLEEEEALVLGVDKVLPGAGIRNFPFKGRVGESGHCCCV